MVDLRVFLRLEPKTPLEQCKVIIAEFNAVKLGFVVDAVERIYRINSEDLDSTLTGKYLGQWVLYVIKRDTRNVLLLDYEAIVQTISPQLSIAGNLAASNVADMTARLGDLTDYRIIAAEDSPLIRTQIKDALTAGGFANVTLCSDGKEAYDRIMAPGVSGMVLHPGHLRISRVLSTLMAKD
jgi:two-component system chemotaxis response regulator CheV